MARIIKQGTCGANGDNLTWTLDNEGLLTISGEGGMNNYYFSDSPFCKNTNITKVKISHGVTSIGNWTFEGCKALTSIEIPDSVTRIGKWAFMQCEALKKIKIPNSVTSIGDWAFMQCEALTSITIGGSVHLDYNQNGYREGDGFCKRVGLTTCKKLTTIEIAEGMTSIGESAFKGCEALTSIEIPNSVTSIGSSAFYGCKALTSINIPNRVTKIGWRVFDECKALTSIDVADDNANYTSIDGVLYDKEKEKLICCPESKTNIEIPNSVTSIGSSAFYGCKALTSIEVVEDNANYASVNGVLYDKGKKTLIQCPRGKTSIEIPNSVTSIGSSAFRGCEALTSIEVVEDNANYASVNGVLYDKGKKTLIQCPRGKTSIEIPNSVTSFGDGAFGGCKALTNIKIGCSVNLWSYNKDVWYGYDKRTITIGFSEHVGLTTCEKLTTIEIAEGVTSIGDEAFSECEALTSIEIPNSVASIGYRAFFGCKALTSVEIPNSVTSISTGAFEGCEALTNIDVAEGNANYVSIDGVLYDKEKKTLIQCPGRKNNIEIPNSVTEIGDDAFWICKALTSIEIPNSVTRIGESAFAGCEALKKIKIPNSVTSIGDYAFAWCKALKKIKIPNSVTSIGSSAFYGCKALTNIDVAEDNANYTSIDGALFDKEKKILICCPESKTTLKIPHSVTKIEDGGKSLKNIYIQCEHPEDLKIHEEAFYKTNIENCTLHVPAGSKERYRQHPAFRKFKKIKVKHDNFIDFIMYLIGNI